jgi:hypothetical protein
VSCDRFRAAVREVTRGDQPPEGCFADEVAIDFPSVGQLAERMRAPFLEEDGGPDVLLTEVSLSSRDASVGAVIPLDVPLRGTCPECGGRGETWTEPCASCCGTGDSLVHHAVRVSVPAGVAHGSRFRFRISSPYAAPIRVEVRVAIEQT